MLKLISKRSQPLSQGRVFQMVENKDRLPKEQIQGFLWDFHEMSAGIYVARFQDRFHELACEFMFELKEILLPSEGESEEGYLQPVLVGDFPPINTRRFLEKVLWDEFLQGMILIQFQLKILEQILLFCEDKHATHLFLTFNETNQDYLEIYQRFITSEEQFGESTESTIPTDVRVYDDLVDFIEEVNHKFRHTLWSEQRTNSIYRHYLKSEALI